MAGLAKLRTKVKGLRRLSWSERRVFAWALVMLPLTRLGLRVKDLNTVQRWLTPRRDRPDRPTDNAALTEAQQLARIVNLAARHGAVQANCLPLHGCVVTITTAWHGCQLRIGVGKPDPVNPQFHAWVESEGHVVNVTPDVAEHYLPFKGAIEPPTLGSDRHPAYGLGS